MPFDGNRWNDKKVIIEFIISFCNFTLESFWNLYINKNMIVSCFENTMQNLFFFMIDGEL